jgi:hypothetical protein
MVNPNRFYTYAYLREDRTPYYVGKGSGGRAYRRVRRVRPPKDKSRIIFLKQNLTEEEAFKHEIYMIDVFGRIDLGTGILHNRTDGGEGASGFVHSDETKRKWSERMKGKNNPMYGKLRSEEIRSKLSEQMKGESNPFYGKSHSKETKQRWSEQRKGTKYSEQTKQKLSEQRKGRKWWNDGCGNNKFCLECPGEGWIAGISEEMKRKIREVKKGKSSYNWGKKWWNDGCGNTKRSVECPGEGWKIGRK